jgi:hypothetical protein
MQSRRIMQCVPRALSVTVLMTGLVLAGCQGRDPAGAQGAPAASDPSYTLPSASAPAESATSTPPPAPSATTGTTSNAGTAPAPASDDRSTQKK